MSERRRRESKSDFGDFFIEVLDLLSVDAILEAITAILSAL